MSRSIRRLPVIFLATLWFACPGCGTAPRTSTSDALRNSILTLRRRGDYGSASRRADSVIAGIRRDWRSRAHEIADAEVLAATLRQAAGLAAGARARLSQADRLEAAIDKLARDGAFPEARQAARRQLEIRQAVLGREHAEVAASLDRLGQLAIEGGAYLEAMEWHRQALGMRERVLGPRHPEVVRSLNHLAEVNKKQGRRSPAKETFEQALALGRDVLGRDSPEVAESLNGLANIYRALERFETARKLMVEALAIQRRALGENSLEVAGTRMDLGLVLLRLGHWKKAERELARSLAAQRALLGPDHPSLGLLASLLGHCRQAQGRYSEALEAHRESVRIWEIRERRLDPGAIAAIRRFIQFDDIAANLLALGRDEEAWPARERGIGRQTLSLLSSHSDSMRAVRPAGGPAGDPPPFSLERVQRALPERAALIGWLDVTPGIKEAHSAWGYVLRDRGPVRWVRLRRGTLILGAHRPGYWDPLFMSLSAAADWPIRVDSTARFTRLGMSLWRERIAPLMPCLDGVRELIVENSGGFRCPVEALIDSAGASLAERFDISYANSATVYAWLRERGRLRRSRSSPGATPSGLHRRALAVGDPPFSETQLDAMNEEGQGRVASGFDALPDRVRLPGSRVLRDAASGDRKALARLPRLPATRWEVERLAEAIPGTEVLIGPQASEPALYALGRSGRLQRFDTIHFATHTLRGIETASLVLAQVGAGAQPSREAAGPEDGVLRLDEIMSRLPLSADLVTLSGCTSGEAGYVYGEGILGLGQAFLCAGAQSVLVSLWRTDDRASALLMSRFYQNLAGSYAEERGLGPGVPMRKVEALREAKNWLRGYRDADGERPYRNPAYWAAFILVGDPG